MVLNTAAVLVTCVAFIAGISEADRLVAPVTNPLVLTVNFVYVP